VFVMCFDCFECVTNDCCMLLCNLHRQRVFLGGCALLYAWFSKVSASCTWRLNTCCRVRMVCGVCGATFML
jgi:hypothetical protein